MKILKNNSEEINKKLKDILNQLIDITEMDSFQSDETTVGYFSELPDNLFQSIKLDIKLIKRHDKK